MSYLATTIMDEYRLPYANTQADQHEHRMANYGILEGFKEDTPNLVDVNMISGNKTYQDQTTSYPVIKRTSYTISTTRSCTAIAKYRESAWVNVTFATMRSGFKMIPAEHEYNVLKYMNIFKRQMDDMQRDFNAALDALAYTTINSAISAVNNADGNPYNVVSNVMQVPADDQELYFNEIGGVFKQNDFTNTDLKFICSPRIDPMIRHLGAQGSGNSTNLAYQFMGYDFKYSRNVAVEATDRDTIFAYAPGSLGFVTWIDPDSRLGSKTHDRIWSVEPMPLLGFDVGMLYTDGCDDNSTVAGNGMEASKYESFIFSFDYAFITAYNSDSTTYPGSIYKSAFNKI